MLMLLRNQIYKNRVQYINAGKLSSSKTASVDINYKNGNIPTSLLTIDASGNMNVLDVKHLESLLEGSIERRSREWGEWAKSQAKTYTYGVKGNLETDLESKIANAQRNSRRDSYDINVGGKWFTGNHDEWVRLTTGEGSNTYSHGFAAKNLYATDSMYIAKDIKILQGSTWKTYSTANLIKALDTALSNPVLYSDRIYFESKTNAKGLMVNKCGWPGNSRGDCDVVIKQGVPKPGSVAANLGDPNGAAFSVHKWGT